MFKIVHIKDYIWARIIILNILNTIPLIGAIVALLLGILILSSKQKNKAPRIVLSLIVFMSAHNLVESYLYYHGFDSAWLGVSYLHYHLIGALFLLYTHLLFRIEFNLKLWIGVLIGFTLIRLAVLEPVEEDTFENITDFTPEAIALIVDYTLSQLLNIALLTLAFLKIRKLRFVVELSKKEVLNLRWLKTLLIISIGIYIAILASGVVSLFDGERWLLYFKIESLFISIFLLSIAYAAMRFPVFAIHGHFDDLPDEPQKKYAKSSLKEVASDQMWDELKRIMEQDKPYRNPEYRLNHLATQLNKSVHHVSQVINEKEGISFSDYINKFRVQDARDLLRSQRSKQVTILAISLEAGFNSKTAFYNTFKKFTGKTPSEFIKENESRLALSPE